MKQFFMFLVVALIGGAVNCFVPAPPTRPTNKLGTSTLFAETAASTDDAAIDDDDEIVGRRIIVKGDVNGGYYRSCVLNEAGRFRRLIGTMTPPDDSDTAEIYVEGKKKMVEGFIRWCKRGKVGLNQVTKVDEIFEEDPTGLYDDFYCKTH